MASARIYTGRWTDWSYGSVLGDRVTLPAGDAGTLTAFIAIFDAFVGGMAWNLVNFFMHRWSATPKARDGMHNQLQILLRNSTEPLSFTWQALYVGYRWHGRVSRAIPRAIMVSVIPASIAVLFSLAGVFSSRIASYGDVLLVGGNCGLEIQYTASTTPAQSEAFDVAQAAQNGINMALGNAYAQNCYSNPLYPLTAEIAGEYAPGANCATFVKQSLNYTASFGNTCPFEQACSVPDSQIITMDTGWLNSHDHLGLNQPPKNRVTFRKWTTCSPLTTEGFSTNEFQPVDGFQDIGNISTYNYGINTAQPTRLGYPSDSPGPNTTFVYSTSEYSSANIIYYVLTTSSMQYGQEGYVYVPLPNVSQNSYAPISLFFLGNRATYLEKVEDPWFQATTPLQVQTELQDANGGVFTENQTVWIQNLPGTMLGCLEQVQFCNPNFANFSACTGSDDWYTYGGFEGYYTEPDQYTNFTDPFPGGMGMNPIQMSTMMGIQTSLLYSQTYEIVQQLGVQALLATNFLYSADSSASFQLPVNQWQIEVANWFSVGLSVVQHAFISGWRRPSEAQFTDFWQPFRPNDTAELNICRNQKVKGSAYQSFSVFALVFNFVVGAVITAASFAVTYVIPRVKNRRGGRSNRKSWGPRDQWISHGLFQTQRMLYESLGQGDWEGDAESVPIARKGQLFTAPGIGRVKDDVELHPTTRTDTTATTPTKFAAGSVSVLSGTESPRQRENSSVSRDGLLAPSHERSSTFGHYQKASQRVTTSQLDDDDSTASAPLM